MAVEGLLRHASSGERISRTISGAATLVSQPIAMAGQYRLVEEIGCGGMGAVYLAQRADGVFEKKVAIKFARHGMDSPMLRRRFEEKRRILARLDHPNIARLINGGATEHGQPYRVMEYVQGKSISEYVRRRPRRAREDRALSGSLRSGPLRASESRSAS
ncbi:MAG TPA: protein kinase [Candidatus Solibacter sp.]|nr:protein kinase [Candidatus Solibacter sp.]